MWLRVCSNRCAALPLIWFPDPWGSLYSSQSSSRWAKRAPSVLTYLALPEPCCLSEESSSSFCCPLQQEPWVLKSGELWVSWGLSLRVISEEDRRGKGGWGWTWWREERSRAATLASGARRSETKRQQWKLGEERTGDHFLWETKNQTVWDTWFQVTTIRLFTHSFICS